MIKQDAVKKTVAVMMASALATAANAGMLTSKIVKLGCHIDSNVCFVYLESEIQTNCPNNDKSLRWDGISAVNSDKICSTLLAAQAQGKSVTFGGAGDSCYADFPTFRWAHSH